MDHDHHIDEGKTPGFFRSRAGLVFIVFALIAGYYLWTEHRAHLALAIPYLPYLFLLACPLMHIFMHSGHHHHHRTASPRDDERPRP